MVSETRITALVVPVAVDIVAVSHRVKRRITALVVPVAVDIVAVSHRVKRRLLLLLFL